MGARRLRIVLVNQFYPPDLAPTGQYLHDLARDLAERGHHVRVICSRRDYGGGGWYPASETRDGVRVTRLSAFGFGRRTRLAKLLDYLSFMVGLALVLPVAAAGADAVVSLTTPPWLGLAARWAARAPRVQWIMDLYPDVLVAHRHPLAAFAAPLSSLTRRELEGAAAVVVPGGRVARRVAALAGRRRPLALPLWSRLGRTEGGRERARATLGWGPDELVLLYSGNLGLGHPLDVFLAAAQLAGPLGPRWVFAGAGPRRGEVERFAAAHPAARIQVLGYATAAEHAARLAAADVMLASLDPRWQGAMVPSKVQTVMASGRPLILVGGTDNEAADWLAASGGGWTVAPGDAAALAAAVAAAADPHERARRGRAAEAFAARRFGPAQRQRMRRIIESAGAARR